MKNINLNNSMMMMASLGMMMSMAYCRAVYAPSDYC